MGCNHRVTVGCYHRVTVGYNHRVTVRCNHRVRLGYNHRVTLGCNHNFHVKTRPLHCSLFCLAAKNIILRCAAKEKQDKSSFLRKCVSHATPEDAERHPVTSSLTSSLTSKAAASEPAAQVDKAQQFIDNKAVCFKFNFGVSDSTGDMPTDSSDNGPGGSDSCSVNTHTLAHDHTVAHDCCAFKVLPSDNSFKFNFTAIQDDQT